MKHSRAATRKRSGRAGGLGRRLSPQFAAIAITSVLRDTISPAADSTGGRPLAIAQWWPRHRRCWTLIWSLIDPVSCVSCVSWMRWLYAAETHETFHRESGMRYQTRLHRPDPRSDRVVSLPPDRGLGPYLGPYRAMARWPGLDQEPGHPCSPASAATLRRAGPWPWLAGWWTRTPSTGPAERLCGRSLVKLHREQSLSASCFVCHIRSRISWSGCRESSSRPQLRPLTVCSVTAYG